MRTRIAALFAATVIALAFNAHAATPTVSLVAVNTRGEAVILSTSNNVFIVKDTATAAPVRLKLTCLILEKGKGVFSFSPLPLPTVPIAFTELFASGKAGGKTYYFRGASIAQSGNKTRQAVVQFGIDRIARTQHCSASPKEAQGHGLAIYG